MSTQKSTVKYLETNVLLFFKKHIIFFLFFIYYIIFILFFGFLRYAHAYERTGSYAPASPVALCFTQGEKRVSE